MSFSLRTEYKKYPLYDSNDTNAKCIVGPFSHYDTTFNMSYMKNIQISIDRQEDFNDQSDSLKSFNTITDQQLLSRFLSTPYNQPCCTNYEINE